MSEPPTNLHRAQSHDVLEAAPWSKSFLFRFLQQPSIRLTLSQMASGTGGSMKNISQGRLKTLPVICPPKNLQFEFETRVEQATAVKRRIIEAASLGERTSAALMARLF